MRMPSRLALAALALWAATGRPVLAETQVVDVSRSVVRVSSTQRRPDLQRPWTHLPQRDVNGSGVVIEGRRILTNAQLVKYASRVLVEPDHTGEKLSATVEFLADDVDLAVLKLEDPAFFDAHPPLPRRVGLPAVKDSILAYGYPLGGDNLAITRGIVSRIEFEEYYYGTLGLRIQVDAAINPGNSGGPALIDDRMIGIIFNRLGRARTTSATSSPTRRSSLFLADIADGTYDGKPQIVETMQTAENKARRAVALKLPKDVHGMVCRRPAVNGVDSGLRPMDVLTEIGGHPIDIAGKVKVNGGAPDRLPLFRPEAGRRTWSGPREAPSATAARSDLPLRVTSGLRRRRRSCRSSWAASRPTSSGGRWLSPPRPRITSTTSTARLVARALVSLPDLQPEPDGRPAGRIPASRASRCSGRGRPLFPHRISKGYTSPASYVVDAVDGTKVRNLRHLVELLRDSKGERTTITFIDKSSEVFVFDRKEVLDATEEILDENGIRRRLLRTTSRTCSRSRIEVPSAKLDRSRGGPSETLAPRILEN